MKETVLPMLAVAGEPFDSPDYLFELKWNGVRALAAIERGTWRLWGRERADYTPRYPELDGLRSLPPGTMLDGELVLLRHGLPDLYALLARHHLVSPQKIRHSSRLCPVTYVVFDLVCHRGQELFTEPLRTRREILEELLGVVKVPRLMLSPRVVGPGRALFAQAIELGHEGVMAKHLAGCYVPGRRSAAWRKIKPHRPASSRVFHPRKH